MRNGAAPSHPHAPSPTPGGGLGFLCACTAFTVLALAAAFALLPAGPVSAETHAVPAQPARPAPGDTGVPPASSMFTGASTAPEVQPPTF